MYEPDFGPNGDMMIGELSEVTSDIAIMDPEERKRGVFYTDNMKAVAYIREHECIEDFYKTLEHELIHGLIEEEKEDSEIKVHLGHEHWIIRQMAWAEESLV